MTHYSYYGFKNHTLVVENGAHTCDHRTEMTEAEGQQVPGQYRLHNETLSPTVGLTEDQGEGTVGKGPKDVL